MFKLEENEFSVRNTSPGTTEFTVREKSLLIRTLALMEIVKHLQKFRLLKLEQFKSFFVNFVSFFFDCQSSVSKTPTYSLSSNVVLQRSCGF